jgi:acylphosphatase
MKILEIYVSGRVQGVSYRYYTLKKAISLHITGEVKNLPDGRVMIIAAGNESNLELFLDELRQGPSYSNVTELK